ncbi:MAG: hypothetical protein U0175_37055 [Caldilineaceae bacterium]
MKSWLTLFFTFLVFAACTPSNATVDLPVALPSSHFPTLDDLWEGRAAFRVDVQDTGLPMGESDTVVVDGQFRSYLHASKRSAGVVDQCGDPVEFPGCVVILQSPDKGRSFQPLKENSQGQPVCQIPCLSCPCDSKRDQIDQQQYPRVAHSADAGWLMVYEYRANTMLRRSPDGLQWSPAEEVPLTGIWQQWLMPCAAYERVGDHPFAARSYDCLIGGPPGISLLSQNFFVFVGMGQNPGHLGCLVGNVNAPASLMRKCLANPLFSGASDYGPLQQSNVAANPFFDFRTISSADTLQVGTHLYLFYEGVRGPTRNAPGDTQFALGLARSVGSEFDGPWQTYPGNPLLVDLPGNIGVGHADVVVYEGKTYLYTSLDGKVRSRLVLVWR